MRTIKKNILAISGSIRKSSSNLGLIKGIIELYSNKFDIKIFEGLSTIPHFNPDLDTEHPPAEVLDFRLQLKQADGILICTHGYAMGVPGTLKNAIAGYSLIQSKSLYKSSNMINFRKIQKPGNDEYPAYSHIYMDLLKDDGLILDHLHTNYYKIKKFIYILPHEMLIYRYAEGKWTIKQILVHLIDDERIFAYRGLRYARNDGTVLHGFEQDQYAKYSGANERSLESIFDEYEAVRKSTLLLFQYLPEEALMRRGRIIDTDGNMINERTVRALVYHIAGHELRHIKVIKERYLNMPVEDEII